MKILITGASGLLGANIAQTLKSHEKELKLEKLLLQRFQSAPGFISADLTSEQGLKTLTAEEWDVVIHTAANKDPDSCEKDHAGTDALNVYATHFLAQEASRRNAYMIYICTDYVFPGKNPPYNEQADPAPTNYYGKSKLNGEREVLNASDKFCSLRVPILYGSAAGLQHSALLAGSIKALLNQKEQLIDDAIVRYPTYTGDVAEAIVLLIKNRAEGIFHCTGNDKTSKYQICVEMADILGLSHEHIFPLENPPESKAKRPYDCHLTMEKLKALGFPEPLPLRERIKSLKKELSEFIGSL